jgi:DNA-binding NarL/FixJ family response regulator
MTEKQNILIVDDNRYFVDRIIGILKDCGHVAYIDSAYSYEDALAFVESGTSGIILLDINLQGKNGLDLLKIIRTKNLPFRVIVLSNHADEYYRTTSELLGADYFLDKSNEFCLLPQIIGLFRNASPGFHFDHQPLKIKSNTR